MKGREKIAKHSAAIILLYFAMTRDVSGVSRALIAREPMFHVKSAKFFLLDYTQHFN